MPLTTFRPVGLRKPGRSFFVALEENQTVLWKLAVADPDEGTAMLNLAGCRSDQKMDRGLGGTQGSPRRKQPDFSDFIGLYQPNPSHPRSICLLSDRLLVLLGLNRPMVRRSGYQPDNFGILWICLVRGACHAGSVTYDVDLHRTEPLP